MVYIGGPFGTVLATIAKQHPTSSFNHLQNKISYLVATQHIYSIASTMPNGRRFVGMTTNCLFQLFIIMHRIDSTPADPCNIKHSSTTSLLNKDGACRKLLCKIIVHSTW
jgi:hypothetical protein